MNTQVEKLRIIEWLVQLQDLSLLEEIKALKEKNERTISPRNVEIMTTEKKLARTQASEEDIKTGRVHTIEEVMKENWD